MFGSIQLDTRSDTPIYKQLADALSALIEGSALEAGQRLPATRELAGLLRINRTTVSAAYSFLEQQGLIAGQVGRGSFVCSRDRRTHSILAHWDRLLPAHTNSSARANSHPTGKRPSISFASSRPAEDSFPLQAFRAAVETAVTGPEASRILQLGSPQGYEPLRSFLLAQARAEGTARADDDLLVTNGCQQALDLIAKVFSDPSSLVGVALEDPVYHGMTRVFTRAGIQLYPVPVDEHGMQPGALEAVLERCRPRLLILTPSFQNPTGATLPMERRFQIITLAHRFGCVLVENDIYSALHYEAPPPPALKQLDETGNTILLRSYSKVSFPGLRVGWVVAPWPVVARLAEAKETSDLHSDQLSQAVLFHFAQCGELDLHLRRTRMEGRARLEAALAACARFLPEGTRWTRPQGGLNLWVELPPPLEAEALLEAASAAGVDYLPGSVFSVRGAHRRHLRLSFGSLTPEQIRRGIQILGDLAQKQLVLSEDRSVHERTAALV